MMLKVDINNLIRRDRNKNVEVLNDINFEMAEGKVYTVLGKNGSGKSTLIKSLTNLLNENLFNISGNVIWNDENVFLMSEDRLLILRQEEIRYVLQDLTNNFDPLKKLNYYFDISGFAEEVISEHLKSFLLPDFETISQLHAYEISGGMAQRLSLMLALMPNPKLLILDEPTSAIDYTNINLLKLKLKKFTSNNNSTLIVTQDIYFAKEVSDEIAFLNKGTLRDFESCDSFFNDASDNAYSNFLKSFEMLQ
jgi:ABC-type glutathione transport system ATPase component